MSTTNWHRRVFDALARMQQALASMSHMADVGDVLIAELCRLVPARSASLMRWDADAAVLRVVAARGMPKSVQRTVAVRPGEGISGRVFAQSRADRGTGRVRGRYQSRAYCTVPLLPWSAALHQIPLGVLNLTNKRDGTAWTTDEQAAVELFAHHAATYLHLWQLQDTAVQHARWDAELDVARRMQQRTWPARPLRSRGATAIGWCVPADVVGGDSYDYWQHNGITTLISIDVAGHSISAALTTHAVQTVIAGLRHAALTPAALLHAMQHALWRDLQANAQTVAVAVLQYDAARQQLYAATAGHPPLLRWQAARQQLQWVTMGGPPLGAVADMTWEEERWAVQPGDCWAALSDGVLAAWGGLSIQRGLRRGRQWLRSALIEDSWLTTIRRLRRDVEALSERTDDATVVALQLSA